MSRRRTVGVETDPLTYEAYSKMSEAEAVGVAFAHRAEAFEAARWLIDTL